MPAPDPCERLYQAPARPRAQPSSPARSSPLSARVEGASVVLEVQDTGHGIAERDRAQLFTPFHRGGHAHGRIEGSGIGLSLTRSLAVLMQGQVELGDSSPQGSTFRLTLPTA